MKSRGVMLVTGGSRGIGAAISLLAAKQGFDVCINYQSQQAKAEHVMHEIVKLGRKAIIYRADIAQENSVADMFNAIDTSLGVLTVLVNNAGISRPVGPVDELSEADIRRLMDTNITGTLLCCKHALLRMSTKHGGAGGSIINFSSAAARLGGSGRNVFYAASKGAINSLTIGLAQEVAAEAVRVNAISPGVIDTDMQDSLRLAAITPSLPMRRPGTVDEVARSVLWLASEEASYVSGAILGVSGAR